MVGNKSIELFTVYILNCFTVIPNDFCNISLHFSWTACQLYFFLRMVYTVPLIYFNYIRLDTNRLTATFSLFQWYWVFETSLEMIFLITFLKMLYSISWFYTIKIENFSKFIILTISKNGQYSMYVFKSCLSCGQQRMLPKVQPEYWMGYWNEYFILPRSGIAQYHLNAHITSLLRRCCFGERCGAINLLLFELVDIYLLF